MVFTRLLKSTCGKTPAQYFTAELVEIVELFFVNIWNACVVFVFSAPNLGKTVPTSVHSSSD